jgi:hypothetical protein
MSATNPIPAIKQLYQLDDSGQHKLDQLMIEQNEQVLGIQLPPLLYHYLLELGNVAKLNSQHHQLLLLPIERLGDYIIIGKTCDNDGVWGIHQDDLTQLNPMVQMSRNFDAIDSSEVHWFDELPLSVFLLAQAIVNGVNGGLAEHAQIYDFIGDTIPTNLPDTFNTMATELLELRQVHERYYQADAFGVVMMVSLDDEQRPTAFCIGSQEKALFNDWLTRLSLQHESA